MPVQNPIVNANPTLASTEMNPTAALTEMITLSSELALLQLTPSIALSTAVGSGHAGHSTTSLVTNATSSLSEQGHNQHPSLPPSQNAPTSESTHSSVALPYFVSNEQLTGSGLHLPIATVAAVWRSFRIIDWVNNHFDPRPFPTQENIFDFAALVQATLDILVPSAVHHSIELVLHHSVGDQLDKLNADADLIQVAMIEAFVRADEHGLTLALLAASLHSRLSQTRT